MYSEKWSDEELAQLAEAKEDDVTTWPARTVQDLEELLSEEPGWVEQSVQGLGRLRELIIEEELKRRLAKHYVFLSECIEALYSLVGKSTVGWHIVSHLDLEVPYGLSSDVVGECMELVPRLNKVLPLFDPEDILAAMLKDA